MAIILYAGAPRRFPHAISMLGQILPEFRGKRFPLNRHWLPSSLETQMVIRVAEWREDERVAHPGDR
jgi:hypothetical protein